MHILQNVPSFQLTLNSILHESPEEIVWSTGENGTEIDYPNPNPTQFKLQDLLLIAGITNYQSI